jgi:hypothetical protein
MVKRADCMKSKCRKGMKSRLIFIIATCFVLFSGGLCMAEEKKNVSEELKN